MNYSLVCPLLTDDPQFAYGVEFGLLRARMVSDDSEIQDYFFIENQDRIFLLASRDGWFVEEWKPWGNEWFWCRLTKK